MLDSTATHLPPLHEARRFVRRQRVLAVLAAGLVLGAGAVHSLAYWTSGSHLAVTITTGDFPEP